MSEVPRECVLLTWAQSCERPHSLRPMGRWQRLTSIPEVEAQRMAKPCSGSCVDVHCVCGMCPPSLYSPPPDVSSYTCLHDPAAYVTPASPSIHLLFLAAQLFIVNTLSFLVAASFHQSPVHPMPFSLCMLSVFISMPAQVSSLEPCKDSAENPLQGRESSGRYGSEIQFQD